jgi:hypothetical protein
MPAAAQGIRQTDGAAASNKVYFRVGTAEGATATATGDVCVDYSPSGHRYLGRPFRLRGRNYDEECHGSVYVAWLGRAVTKVSPNIGRCRGAAAAPFPREEFERMNKAIIVSLAILGLSTSAALAANTHHAKKPAAAPAATTYPAETHLFQVSDADKQLYAKNKRESGVK